MLGPLSKPYGTAAWSFHWVMNLLLRFVLFACVRWEVVGLDHVPKMGAFILAANHISNADPPTLAAASHRRVIFMAKEELLRVPVAGWIMRFWGAFGVRREEADLAALRQAQAVLKTGTVLGMFPEGTRARGRGLCAAHPGVAMLAMRSEALIVPAAISGTEKLLGPGMPLLPFRRPLVRVSFGEPFRLSRKQKRLSVADMQAGADQIMRRIAELLPPEYLGEGGRAILAGEQRPEAKPS